MLLLTVSFSVFSCSKTERISENPDAKSKLLATPKLENGMLAFSDYASFENFISKIDAGADVDIPKFNSLLEVITEASRSEQENDDKINDLIDFDFPTSYQKVLNKDGKVKIGNEFVWYTQGKKYFIPSEDAELMTVASLERAGVKSLAVGKNIIGIQLNKTGNNVLSTNNSRFQGGEKIMSANNTISSIDIGVNGLDAKYQHEFYATAPAAGCRKYVHEIFTFFDGYYNVGGAVIYTAYAYLRIKLEWKTCSRSKWNLASEMRNITYSINGSAEAMNFSFGGYDPGPSFNLNSTTTSNGILSVLLAKRGGSGTMTNPYWRISMSGSISQHIIGDSPSNLWTNTGNPLW